MQILVIGRLDKGENIWLSRLREDLELHGDIEPLMAEYRKEKQNCYMEAAMGFNHPPTGKTVRREK